MDSSPLVTKGHGYRSVFTEVEVVAIVMVVWSNPSDPHASRVLTSKDPHRMVILERHVDKYEFAGVATKGCFIMIKSSFVPK